MQGLDSLLVYLNLDEVSKSWTPAPLSHIQIVVENGLQPWYGMPLKTVEEELHFEPQLSKDSANSTPDCDLMSIPMFNFSRSFIRFETKQF